VDLLDEIDAWATAAGERAAHISGERILTYLELRERSDALAAWLADADAESRAPVAMLGHKEPEMLIAFLAAVKAGRPYVPIDVSIPAQRIERIVQSSGATLTLTPERVAELSSGTATGFRRRPLSSSDPFYILFTSGSTGEPKGVVITLGNLTAFIGWMRAEHRFPPGGEVFLNQAPFSFDLSVMDLYLSLTTGGTLFSITKEHIANLKALYLAFATAGITTWVSTPSFAQMCLIERSFAAGMLPQLKRFLFCGETLASETAAQLLDRFPEAEVWNTYGPTEATVATTSVRIDRAALERWSPLPVGRAMPGTSVLILDADQRPVVAGERGEIVIAGRNVSPGYVGRADLTARAFFEFEGMPAYRTGDWGRAQDELIFCEGRMDGQIKLHGYRIELGDLEANLRALPEIADAVVLPVTKNGRTDSLAAFVVLAEERTGTDFELSAKLKGRLGERGPAYMIPRKFQFLDAFPMTPNGKADRRALAARLG
jgi:D-alanine--poly(phosphoribitol) ligase subunit 1